MLLRKKKAYVRLTQDYDALDVANRIGCPSVQSGKRACQKTMAKQGRRCGFAILVWTLVVLIGHAQLAE